MKTREKVALLSLMVLLIFLAGCYTQVGRPKVKTEGDVAEEYYVEEREEAGRPDTVVYHRHDVYFHPPMYYRPLWIDYWWWDAWSWYYDPYWYWRRGFVPGYYVGIYFGWGDPWWPYWSYPYWGPEVFYWRPAGFYGGWAYYQSYWWWGYTSVEPAKRRPFVRRHLPPPGLTGIAVGAGSTSSPGSTLERRTVERRTSTIHESPATIARDRSSTTPSTESLRRVPRPESSPQTGESRESRQRQESEVRRVPSPERRAPSEGREIRREKSSDSERRSPSGGDTPRVSRPSAPPQMEPAPPPKRSSGSEGSARRTRSEYSPSIERRSAPSVPVPSVPSEARREGYGRLAVPHPTPPPSSGGGGSSNDRPSRRRSS
jgi:hypothetical protein